MELRRSQRRSFSSYRDLLSCKIPRIRRASTKKYDAQKLYSVEIIEREDDRVKVHYVGYSSKYDEWKDKFEIEFSQCDRVEDEVANIYEPFSLYKDLSLKIKRALSCNRTASPNIKISMPFDLLLFNGGLKLAATPARKSGGIQYYRINNYKDLYPFLGVNWHIRGINGNGDYGYVLKETVEFCVRRSRRLTEYVYTPDDDTILKSSIDAGYTLTFSFICGFGNKETFGKDKSIFV